MSTPKYRTTAAVAQGFDLDAKPERWLPGEPFDALDVRPGRVILIGAPPATGKTTLALQFTTQLLERQPMLRAVVANVETAATLLLEKLLARYGQVPLDAIMNRTLLSSERDRIQAALRDRADILERLAFLDAPHTLGHLTATMIQHEARLAVVDYVQRFCPDDGTDARLRLDAVMSNVRKLADAGACVVLISSVARQKSSSGSSYSGLSMASFRGSAELEFGADSAYILLRESANTARLECVKQRWGEIRDLYFGFDGPLQTFRTGDPLDAFDDCPAPLIRGAQ